MEPDAVRVFGDVCELVGRICALSGDEGMEEERTGAGSLGDLLVAHKKLSDVPGVGELRTGEARVLRGARVAHLPPLASRLPLLMNEFMEWLGETKEHPVIVSCACHYYLLYVHPFEDGNGRIARLWQERILRKWRPCLRGIDLERAVELNKDAYLDVLAVADRRKDSGVFAEFMLGLLLGELRRMEKEIGERNAPRVGGGTEFAPSEKPGKPYKNIPEAIERLLQAFNHRTLKANDLMEALGLIHRGTFRKNYLDVAIKLGLVELTQPRSPRSPTQKYRLSPTGKKELAKLKSAG